MNKTYTPAALDRSKYFNTQAFLIIIFLLAAHRVSAQQQQNLINYTQFANNITAFNPAYSLIDKAASVSTLLGRQFTEIQTGAPTNFLVNLNLPFESVNGDGGLFVKNNSIGPETLTEINAFFAKSVQLTDQDFLAVSLNAGFRKYVFLNPDPSDPEFTDVRQTNPNLGFGVMLYSSTYFIGLSAPELTIRSLGNASLQTQANLTNHYYLAGAFLANMDEDFTFKPAVLIAYARGANVVAAVSGTLYIKNILGLGAGYRTDKQASGIISYTFNYFMLGYSYQVGTASNDFGGINSATHEVTLSYRFGKGSLNPQLL